MTIYTAKIPMIGDVKISGIYYVVGVHSLLDISLNPIIIIIIVCMPMTFQASLVFFQKLVFPGIFFHRVLG
jgi:hypothetical protein